MFATFIDLKKAFDFIDRELLLYILLLLNTDGKIYNSIKSIYSKTTASIRVNNTLTEWLDCRSDIPYYLVYMKNQLSLKQTTKNYMGHNTRKCPFRQKFDIKETSLI